MNPEEVDRKAAWLLEPVLGKEKSNKIIATSRHLESFGSVRELAGLLTVD
jgi:hypothetical protein